MPALLISHDPYVADWICKPNHGRLDAQFRNCSLLVSYIEISQPHPGLSYSDPRRSIYPLPVTSAPPVEFKRMLLGGSYSICQCTCVMRRHFVAIKNLHSGQLISVEHMRTVGWTEVTSNSYVWRHILKMPRLSARAFLPGQGCHIKSEFCPSPRHKIYYTFNPEVAGFAQNVNLAMVHAVHIPYERYMPYMQLNSTDKVVRTALGRDMR